jgi:hypothetical protein
MAWGLIVIAVLSSFVGDRIGHGLQSAIAAVDARFSHAFGIEAGR